MTETWDIPSAITLYNIDQWGSGYFNINAAGNVQVMPTQAYGQAIDLMDVVNEARDRGMAFPLVVRFQDLLRHRFRDFLHLHFHPKSIKLIERQVIK
jgi:arginine decarboxylase